MLRDGSVVECTSNGIEDEHGAKCDRLHHRLKRIVKARGALDAAEAQALREAQELMLWRRYGCASLLEYMEREMGYSPRAAMERLRVAHAIVELPAIAEALTQGDLSFSAAREITRVATPETEGEWIEAIGDKNLREVEHMVSGHVRGERPSDPEDPSLRRQVLRFEVKPETFALYRQAQKVLEQEKGERLDDDALIAAVFRLVLDVRAAQRTHAAYQVAVTVCSECKRGWQDGAGRTVPMSPPAVERALCDAQHIGSLDGNETTRASQTIPPAIRRKVLRRDHGACRVPGCRSKRNLDAHHLVSRSEGGTHTVENLITLCEGHHIAHHAGALTITGKLPNVVFTRSPPSNYKTATRAVDTARVLRELCFKPQEVRVAIEKTKTHVGNADLPIEEWVKIALRYCPRPIT